MADIVEIVDLDRGDADEAVALLRVVAATGTLGRDPDEYEAGVVADSLDHDEVADGAKAIPPCPHRSVHCG